MCQNLGTTIKTVVVDPGYCGLEALNPGVQIIRRGRFKRLTPLHQRWLKRRQVIEPTIGNAKADCRLDRGRLQGAQGDALMR